MSMPVSLCRDLIVWKKSFNLSTKIYKLTRQLPEVERFGIISQLQRAAVSIPWNIAEGQQRNNRKEYRQFLGIARGSAAELETQLLIIKEVYRIEINDCLELLNEVHKMLSVLCKKLEPNH